jgi:hypothetical protein
MDVAKKLPDVHSFVAFASLLQVLTGAMHLLHSVLLPRASRVLTVVAGLRRRCRSPCGITSPISRVAHAQNSFTAGPQARCRADRRSSCRRPPSPAGVAVRRARHIRGGSQARVVLRACSEPACPRIRSEGCVISCRKGREERRRCDCSALSQATSTVIGCSCCISWSGGCTAGGCGAFVCRRSGRGAHAARASRVRN